VRAWWSKRPTSNVGLATGHRFDVLDLDGPDAEARFDAYQLRHDLPMPGDDDGPGAPLWVATPRGLHCYVEPTGAGNRAGGFLGDGIDWRGMGGYVVAPPSMRAEGVYQWVHDPLTPVPSCPEWLAALVTKRTAESGPVAEPRRLERGDVRNRYGLSALRDECERVARAGEGARNDTLNRAAFNVFQLVHGGEVADSLAESWLASAGQACGLAGTEVARTIQSARAAARTSPRRAPVAS
jgi:hypothetical protein